MTDFISIKEAKERGKGNIRFLVVSLGELKSGTTKSGDEWQKQVAVIKDGSGAMDLTLWNENIGEVLDGKSYTLQNAYWTIYKDEPQLSLGKYYKLNEISELTPTTTINDTVKSETSSSPQAHLQTVTQNEMIARIFDMTLEMYHDFIDRKAQN